MRFSTIRKTFVFIGLCIILLHLMLVAITVPLICLYRFVNPPITSVMVYRLVSYRWPLEKVRFIKLKQIPIRTRNMIIRVEDGDFFKHHGILPAALKNAYLVNKQLGRPVYGGSTITMQTARTLFLVPEKSYLRKYMEMIIALEMEAILGKERIFELYLNYAEWGKGVFGIEAAARHHYDRGVTSLSRDQSIRLVTLLSSPILFKPYTIHKSGILKSRYNYLLQRF